MNKLKKYLHQNLEINHALLQKVQDENELLNLLTKYIQEIIDSDFQYFLWLLYKIDVDEKKIKETIKKDPQNSSETIAKLIIERIKEKMKTREKFRNKDKEDDWIFM